MNNTRKHSIIQAFQGEWICTQNIYFFNTKNLYHKKEKIEINTINNKQKHDYYSVRCLDNIEADNSSLIISPTILSKNFNNLNNTYELVTFDQKYITFKTLANKANYYEYLYTINKTLNISISILIENHIYKYIVFTSYIKKNKNNI